MEKREKSHRVESEKPRRVLARTLAEDLAKTERNGRYRTFTKDPEGGDFD